MADASLYVNLVAQVLQNDDALNLMVDGHVVPSFRRSQADQYLAGSKQACIGVRNLQGISDALPGCYFHGGTIEDQLIEISVTHITTDDSYANSIVSAIKDLLKAGLECTYGGVLYKATVMRLIFAPLDDDQFQDRVQIIGTCRIKYLDS
jgi:hypothetical protein